MTATGALLGLAFALGLALVIWGGPPARRPRLEDRLAPYLGRAEITRATLGAHDQPARPRSWRDAARTLAEVLGRHLDRLLGGGPSIRRRWLAANLPAADPFRVSGAGASSTADGYGTTGDYGSAGGYGAPGGYGSAGAYGTGSAFDAVAAFRAEQVRWGTVGSGMGLVLGAASGRLAGLALLPIIGVAIGVLGRDWWLSTQVKRRVEAMRTELPIVAELLALAVTAGEAPVAALRRVSRVSRGELSRELTRTLDESRAGAGLVSALEGLASRSASEPLTRFVDGIVIALERGTPLAEVLRAQAAEAREAEKRELLASGGRREIAMMVPVVFLILPVTVLFALYPGLVSISLLTR